MPAWKRNLIIAGIILVFIWVPASATGFVAYVWHQIGVLLHTIKHANHLR